jgi:hypothetical protein
MTVEQAITLGWVEKTLSVECTDLQDLKLYQGGQRTEVFEIHNQYPERVYLRTETRSTGRYYPKYNEYAQERHHVYLVPKTAN